MSRLHKSPEGRKAIWSSIGDLASSIASSSFIAGSFSHRRRRSSAASNSNAPPSLILEGLVSDTALSHSHSAQTLAPIPGTPSTPMSLSRSPSPRPGGGWASPGLTNPYANVSGRSSPTKTYRGANGDANVTWESAKAKTEGVNGYPSFSTQNNGFFNRHYRRISQSLPRFNLGPDKSFAEKEKLGRGRWMPRDGGRIGRVRSLVRRTSRKAKVCFIIVAAFVLAVIVFHTTRKSPTLSVGHN